MTFRVEDLRHVDVVTQLAKIAEKAHEDDPPRVLTP